MANFKTNIAHLPYCAIRRSVRMMYDISYNQKKVQEHFEGSDFEF